MEYNETISNKDFGNFNGIFRNDLVKTNGSWALQNIDDNAYFYQNPLSRKISSILDYTGSPLGYKANSGTYAYDANGNTTYDPANKIATVYNYLNLPSKFTKDDGTKQEILYDFSGKKWQVKEFNSADSLLGFRSYLGPFEFENNSLNLVHHEIGFIKNLKSYEYQTGIQNGNIQGSSIVSTQKIGEGKYEAENAICLLPGFESNPNDKFSAEIKTINSQYQWQYALSDHLGNLRVLFTDKNNDGLIRQDADSELNEVLSIRNYSPFGLELSGSHKNLDYQNGYKFGGKELNNFTGSTDFGRRNFDAPLGRFTSQDRFSEKYYGMTTMGYAAGNPIKFIDVNGDSLWISEGRNKYLYNNGQLSLNGQNYTGQIRGFLKETLKALNKISSTEDGVKVLTTLQNSDNNFVIKEGKWSRFEPTNKNDAEAFRAIEEGINPFSFAPPQSKIGSGGNIIYNPNQFATINGVTFSPVIVLAHETFHAFDSNNGQLDSRNIEVNGICCEQRQEIRATYFQNRISQQLGSSYPLREYYGGTKLPPMPPRLLDINNQPINVSPPNRN
jgi:RHS repeat-associated protein